MADSPSQSEKHEQASVEEDLINRYDSMVQTQIRAIHDIDTKAAKAVRVNVLLIGLLLSAISLMYRENGFEAFPLEAKLLLGLGISGLLVSVGAGIVTYLSSVFRHGPSASIGEDFLEKRVREQDYRDYLLDLNSNMVVENRRVVRNNSRRFRRTLLALLLGIIHLSVGIGVSVVDFSTWWNRMSVLGLLLVSLGIVQYVEGEEYLTLNREQ